MTAVRQTDATSLAAIPCSPHTCTNIVFPIFLYMCSSVCPSFLQAASILALASAMAFFTSMAGAATATTPLHRARWWSGYQ